MAAEAAAVRNLDDGGCLIPFCQNPRPDSNRNTGIESNTLYCTIVHKNKIMKGPNYPGPDSNRNTKRNIYDIYIYRSRYIYATILPRFTCTKLNKDQEQRNLIQNRQQYETINVMKTKFTDAMLRCHFADPLSKCSSEICRAHYTAAQVQNLVKVCLVTRK